MTTYSSEQLVLPELVKKPGRRVAAESVRGSMEPATTAASVRREAQRGLMEEWGSGSHPSTLGGSRGSVCSSRTSSAGSVKGRRSVETSATFTPTAPPTGSSRTSDGPRKVARRRQVMDTAIDRRLVTCPDPARQAAGSQPSSSSTQPGAASERQSDPGTVGVINGVPFQTVPGDFGALVDQWLTSSSKALSPKGRRGASARSEPRQDATKQKVKVEKARVKMRRVVDKIGTTDNNSSTKKSPTRRGTRDRRMHS
jgi:hypothetical protein